MRLATEGKIEVEQRKVRLDPEQWSAACKAGKPGIVRLRLARPWTST